MHSMHICSVYAASMVLTGNSMGIAVKFGINFALVVLEMVNFTRLHLVKSIPISNTTLVTGFWKNDPNRTLEVPR